VQVIEIPTHFDSQLHVADVMMEVSIMEMFSHDEGMCSLLDYGVSPDGFHLVMPLYKCDLAVWRSRLPTDVDSCLLLQQLFLNIFSQVILRCQIAT
jgi:hypothetical protein